MGEPLKPTWLDLQTVISLAGNEALLMSPFYSSIGLDKFAAALMPTPQVLVVTRFRLQDWASGTTNPPALRDMIRRFESANRAWTLFALPQLHAKAYVADRQLGLIGSSNLTGGGFCDNDELMVLVEAEEANEASVIIDNMLNGGSQQISLGSLEQWVNAFENRIARMHRLYTKARQYLGAAQADADAMLGVLPRQANGGATVIEPLPPGAAEHHMAFACPDRELCDAFTQWLRRNVHLPGAEKLVENATDTIVGRNQGHFRRFFGSVWLFLKCEAQWCEVLRAWLSANGPEEYYAPSDELRESWQLHLDKYSTLNRNDVCSYPLVQRYLPPRFGGTVVGGGGGVSTFRRMFPVVAGFMLTEEAQQWEEAAKAAGR
jgi:hypothetical protein